MKTSLLSPTLPPKKGSLQIVAHWDLLRTQVKKALLQQLKLKNGTDDSSLVLLRIHHINEGLNSVCI